MLKQVPTVKTAVSNEQLIEAFIVSWHNLFGEYPKKQSIGVLKSQNDLETGGTSHMYNYNLGNVKAVDAAGSTIEYCALNGVWEIINGQKIILPITNPGSWFRAFPTLTDGLNFYLDFLKNHHYASCWNAVEAGDPTQFAHLLKLAHYYTAPEADYVKLINSFYNKFMADQTFDKIISEYQPTVDTSISAPSPAVMPSTLIQPSITSPAVVSAPTNTNVSNISNVLNKVWNFFK